MHFYRFMHYALNKKFSVQHSEKTTTESSDHTPASQEVIEITSKFTESFIENLAGFLGPNQKNSMVLPRSNRHAYANILS